MKGNPGLSTRQQLLSLGVDPIRGFGAMWHQRLKVYGVAELTWEFEHRCGSGLMKSTEQISRI